MLKITQADVEQGFITDDSEIGICMDCKDHAAPDHIIGVSTEGVPYITGEVVSNCCGSKLWTP